MLLKSCKRKEKIKRLYKAFFLTIGLIAFFSQPAVIAQDDSKNEAVSFLVISDWGGKASQNQKAVAAAMGREAEKIKASFVVTLGDNYHEQGIASEKDIRWKTEYEDVYDAPSLQIPWYPCLGNHDYEGNVEGEIQYSNISKRWKLPARYYTQEEKIDSDNSILIVHLDTSPFIEDYRNGDTKNIFLSQDTQKQLTWLDSVLTNTKASYTIVTGHHPVYSSAPTHGDTKELVVNVLPVLLKHHVPMYLCGHDHILQHIKRDNIDFLICGGGAAPRESADREDVVFNKGKTLGFLSVTADKNTLTVNFVDSDNVILHSAVIKNSK